MEVFHSNVLYLHQMEVFINGYLIAIDEVKPMKYENGCAVGILSKNICPPRKILPKVYRNIGM